MLLVLAFGGLESFRLFADSNVEDLRVFYVAHAALTTSYELYGLIAVFRVFPHLGLFYFYFTGCFHNFSWTYIA